MTTSEPHDSAWTAPTACTLPTVERPLRVAEFDDLFASSLLGQARPSPTHLRWTIDPAREEQVRDLTRREAACCSFFTFTLTPAAAGLTVDVEVSPEYSDVLDALAAQAGVTMRS
jgi:hypothetical protein